MSVEFASGVHDEVMQAAVYYSEQRTGLGDRFLDHVHNAIERITDDPTRFEFVDNEIRRCRVRQFPYDVLYSIQRDRILIVAVMHHHRRPGYWKDRVE